MISNKSSSSFFGQSVVFNFFHCLTISSKILWEILQRCLYINRFSLSMVPPAVYASLWSQRFGLVFIFDIYQQTDLDAKRQEAITRLKHLDTELKGDMTTGWHGEMHEQQASSDTRSVTYSYKFQCY